MGIWATDEKGIYEVSEIERTENMTYNTYIPMKDWVDTGNSKETDGYYQSYAEAV